MNLTDALSTISARAARTAEARRSAGDGLSIAAMVAEARRRRRRFMVASAGAAAAAIALVVAGGAAAVHLTDGDPLPPVGPTQSSSPTITTAPTPATRPTRPRVGRAPSRRRRSPRAAIPRRRSNSPAEPAMRLTLTVPDGVLEAGQATVIPPTLETVTGIWGEPAGDTVYVVVARGSLPLAGQVVGVATSPPDASGPIGPNPQGVPFVRVDPVVFTSCVPYLWRALLTVDGPTRRRRPAQRLLRRLRLRPVALDARRHRRVPGATRRSHPAGPGRSCWPPVRSRSRSATRCPSRLQRPRCPPVARTPAASRRRRSAR